METLFNIKFTGEILKGFDKERVKQNLMKLFELTEEQVEKVLSQPGTILKKEISEQTCQKYEAVLAEAGIKTESVAIGVDEEEPVVERDDPELNPAPGTVETKGGKSIPFEFTGKGGEYFSIWLVNILLSIVTLGIYSAWAKVRRKQYFYGNTKLDGSAFEYLADPVKILKGRLIVAAFSICYALSTQFFPPVAIVFGILFLIVLPWLVIRSMAFNAQNSSHRNIRFGFKATYFGAVKTFILWPALGILTFGVMGPFAYYKQVKFLVNHSRYGSTYFEFKAKVRDYYWLILKAILIFIIGFGLSIGSVILFQKADFESGSVYLAANIAGMIPMLIMYFFVFVYFSVRSTNLLFESTKLSSHGFSANLEVWGFTKIFVVNTIATLLTLGIFVPWAKIRVLRYKLTHLGFNAASEIDEFVAAEEEQTSALGEEINDFFDFDLGL